MNPRHVECLSIGNKPVPGRAYGCRELGVIVIGDSLWARSSGLLEKALPSMDLHVLDWSFNAYPTSAEIKSTKDGEQCGDLVR